MNNSLRRVHDHQRALVKTLECSRTLNCADIWKLPPQGWSWTTEVKASVSHLTLSTHYPRIKTPKLRQHRSEELVISLSLCLSLFSSLSSCSFLHFSLVPLSKFFYTEIHKVVLFHYIIFHTYLTCIIHLRRFLLKKKTISEIVT